MSDYEKIENCIDQINSCDFACEGGPLYLNRGWIYLNINIGLMQERIKELEAEKAMLLATVAMLQEDREVTDNE